MATSCYKLFFEWSDELVLDRGPVDAQHEKLVHLISDLESAVSLGKTRECLGPIFDELVEYTMVHFEDEERFMNNAGYPALEGHIGEHHRFGRTALDQQKAFAEGSETVGAELTKFLRDWLVGHILGHDRRFWMFVAEDEKASALKASGEIYK